MTYYPGGGGGGGSIATSSDVALNNVANSEVLVYDGALAKWKNAPAAASGVRSAFLVVAASDAPAAVKGAADYVCDGVDDQIEINAAIAAAALGVGIGWGLVQLTGGFFKVSGSVIMRTGVAVSGSGFLTIVQSVGMGARGVFELFDLNTHLTMLKDMTIDGNFTNGGSSHAIAYRNSDGNLGDPKGLTGDHSATPGNDPDSSHVVSDIFIRAFGGGTRHGVFMDADARDPKVSRVRVRACSGTGFKMNASSDGKYSQNIAIGCGIGWEVGGASNMFTTCKAAYADGDGWQVSSSRAHLVGCHAQDNGRHGFNVTGIDAALTGCVADSNRRLDVAGYGLVIGADRGVFEGIHLYDRGQSAQQQTQGVDFTASATDIYLTGHIRLPSGTAYTNGAPGANSYVRLVRVGSTVYSVG